MQYNYTVHFNNILLTKEIVKCAIAHALVYMSSHAHTQSDLRDNPSPTMFHILNGCPVALNQSRYTWRHDSVLKKMDDFIRSKLTEDDVLFANLPGCWVSETPCQPYLLQC